VVNIWLAKHEFFVNIVMIALYIITYSHDPAWECGLGRSASSSISVAGLKTTRSFAEGIPTEDRGNEEIWRNDSDQRALQSSWPKSLPIGG
jgi:hypothetical protein